MANTIFKSNTFTLGSTSLADGGTVTVEKDAFILSPGTGIELDPGAWTVTINGIVQTADDGIVFDSNPAPVKASKLTIGTEGMVFAGNAGTVGISLGVPVDIVNSGVIYGSDAGIQGDAFGPTTAKGFSITNNATGSISGDVGIELGGAGTPLTLTLKNAGTIAGSSGTAVAWSAGASITNSGLMEGGLKSLDATGTFAATVTNTGTVTGDLLTSDGNDIVSNKGLIDGLVVLHDGTNKLTNNGKIAGDVLFGSGADSLVNTGKIAGGVELFGGINSVANSGTIDEDLIFGSGNDALTNSGSILGLVAMDAGDNKITNSGTIFGDVDFGTGNDLLTHSKLIMGAVDMGDGNNKLGATGDILGAVTFGSGNDTFTTTKLIDDNVSMGDGNNTLTNSGTIQGDVDFGAGNDILTTSKAIAGTVDMGEGNNKLTVSGVVNDIVTFGAGNDIVTVTGTVNEIRLGDGTNTLTSSGFIGDPTGLLGGGLEGGDGVDIVKNTGQIKGIDLRGGDDVFTSGKYDDSIADGKGNDTYSLGAGNDNVAALTGMDKYDGGTGIDSVTFQSLTSGVMVNLDTKAGTLLGNDLLAGSAVSAAAALSATLKNFEEVEGTDFNDVIAGNAVANKIDGADGADIIYGGLGKDSLDGGGSDSDTDTFVYLSTKESGTTVSTRDTIAWFDGAGKAGGDLIDLSSIDADTKTAGDQGFGFIGPNAAFTQGVAGQLRTVSNGTDTLIQADVNGDTVADFSINVVGSHNFIAGDFVL